MRPISQSDGHDTPWLIGELIPSIRTMVEDVIVGLEDSVREPVLTHELPDVLDRVQFWAFCRQRHQGNIGRDFQVAGNVPTGLIEQQHRVSVRRDLG